MLGSSEGSLGDELEKEIGMLLQERRRQVSDDLERELNIYRSGSAPPTVEGSSSAVGGLFQEGSFSVRMGNGSASKDELLCDPAYLSDYYSNVNLKPRIPPPLLSKEDWRFTERLKGRGSVLGGIGDRRKVNNSRPDNDARRSLFSPPPGFDSKKPGSECELENGHRPADWGNDGLIGISGLGLGDKKKSFTEIFQGNLGRAIPVSGHPSRPSSRNCFDENADTISSTEAQLANVDTISNGQREWTSNGNGHTSSEFQNIGSGSSYPYAAVLGSSLSPSNSPDPVIARAPSPCLTPCGRERFATAEKGYMTSSHSLDNLSSTHNKSANLATAFSGMSLPANGAVVGEKIKKPQIEMNGDNHHRETLVSLQGAQNHAKQHHHCFKKTPLGHLEFGGRSEVDKTLLADCHVEKSAASGVASRSSYMKGSPSSTSNCGGNLAAQYPLMGSPYSPFENYGLMGSSVESMLSGQLGMGNLPPLYENVAAASASGGSLPSRSSMATITESSNLNCIANQILGGGALQEPFVDPMYLHYLTTNEYAAQALALSGASGERNYLGNSSFSMLEMQKAYLGSSPVSPQNSMYNVPLSVKTTGSNHHGFYSNQAFEGGLSYPGSPLANLLIPGSPAGHGSPMRHNDCMHMRNFPGLNGGYDMNESLRPSLLEEFKNNKSKFFELSEIAGHVVEFSADQYGSRFIQQKLETATTEEKNMVYREIMPHALNLMTDVFGNYVIQKFFEHGLASQRRELADKLFGHVLSLSLQMYGCRVIQKVIEEVDLDQKVKMVRELDGHIMRCVRDQNGNHVIQKCIECVPEDEIEFIVLTFFDEVVTLSTHPYGCRVIQRVLEHCKDPNTQSKVVDEILGSVSMLAQDQYGNYVVQHVLEHGKPHERSTIIKELTGNIVKMSQQKFASNVVEKCLAFGSADERQILVDEMLEKTDENDPLQAMMKDQFGNYVVQKVLETCDDHQRELILSRIKVHLTALKKYTYGKHIVARLEKLVAAGGDYLKDSGCSISERCVGGSMK